MRNLLGHAIGIARLGPLSVGSTRTRISLSVVSGSFRDLVVLGYTFYLRDRFFDLAWEGHRAFDFDHVVGSTEDTRGARKRSWVSRI